MRWFIRLLLPAICVTSLNAQYPAGRYWVQFSDKEYSDYHYDLKLLEEELASRSEKIVERKLHRRRQYWLRDGGVVEVVRPMHNSEFCNNCTRLRLTSDGHLKPCLMREDNHVEAVQRFRQGGLDALVEAFKEAVALREPYWRK